MKKPTPVFFFDIFDNAFLGQVYDAFEKYINSEKLTENFSDLVDRELVVGRLWENTQIILDNLGAKLTKAHVCIFLESHSYTVWFARKKLVGHKFTELEKSALAAWIFFTESDDNYDEEVDLYEATNDLRESTSEMFCCHVFDTNIDGYLNSFKDFMERNGKTYESLSI